MCANDCAVVYLCLNVNIRTSERKYVLCVFFVCVRLRAALTLALLAVDSASGDLGDCGVCVDKNNETFANRDSVGPLKGLRWGLTLPEDIASDQEGR